jgi:protein tyrosine/serine phosphatase
LLVHCTAGKDRTGVICAVILSLCGVSDEIIAEEYNLTDIGLRERHEEFVTYLTANPALNGDRDAAERMVSAR